MKKYQQLLVTSLGLVSFIFFLIYKHEYDRLRNVLEVLEVFGSPPPIVDQKSLLHQVEHQHPQPPIDVPDYDPHQHNKHHKESDPEKAIKNSGEVIDQEPPSVIASPRGRSKAENSILKSHAPPPEK